MAALDDRENLVTACSTLSSETAIDLVDLVQTALSSLSDDQLSTLTAREYFDNDVDEDDSLSTCLSAPASQYSLPKSETNVELPVNFSTVELLQTALSNDSLATGISAHSYGLLSLTAREDLWSDFEDDDDLSTCLSAAASLYSLPESETNVEMPIILSSGVVIVDSLECLAKLDKFKPIPADVDLNVSYYEMPPSETDVSLAEPELRILA